MILDAIASAWVFVDRRVAFVVWLVGMCWAGRGLR